MLARSANHGAANLVMGLLLMKRERYAEARDALTKAIAAAPDSAAAHYQLSLAYARLGDTLYVHGSSLNRLLRSAAQGAELSLTGLSEMYPTWSFSIIASCTERM